MRKALILLLAFFLLSGFKWGSSYEDENTDTQQQNVSSYSNRGSDSSANTSSYKSKYSTSSSDEAVRNVKETFAADDPDELKTRVESLARISRALKALGKTKGSQ